MRSYPPPIEYPAGNNSDHGGALSGLLFPNRFDVADFARAQGLAYQRATERFAGSEERWVLAEAGNDGTVSVKRSPSGVFDESRLGQGSALTDVMTAGGGTALRGGYASKAVMSYYKAPLTPQW